MCCGVANGMPAARRRCGPRPTAWLQDRAAVHRAGGSGAILAWLRALLQIVAARCRRVWDDAVFLRPPADCPALVITATCPCWKGRTFPPVQGRIPQRAAATQGHTAELADH